MHSIGRRTRRVAPFRRAACRLFAILGDGADRDRAGVVPRVRIGRGLGHRARPSRAGTRPAGGPVGRPRVWPHCGRGRGQAAPGRCIEPARGSAPCWIPRWTVALQRLVGRVAPSRRRRNQLVAAERADGHDRSGCGRVRLAAAHSARSRYAAVPIGSARALRTALRGVKFPQLKHSVIVENKMLESAVSAAIFETNETLFAAKMDLSIAKRVSDALRRPETGLDQTFPRTVVAFVILEISR